MPVPHPIPYQGSKRGLAPTILRYMPPRFDRLIEPFAGSAAVSLAVAYTGRARRFIFGDANEPLMSLWEWIINHPQEIADQYRHHWQAQIGREREYYDLIRDRFNETKQSDCLLYLLARCVKASVRYNSQGQFNQGPDNRRNGTHPDTMQHHILSVSRLLMGRTSLVRGDYTATLAQAEPGDVVYMDPPYQGVCGRRNPRYSAHLDFEAFVAALSLLNARGIPYIVSYDGRTEDRRYGESLPSFLRLEHIEVDAGRSTQATLLGRAERTYESLYLSPELCSRVPDFSTTAPTKPAQMSLVLERCLTKTYQTK